MEILRSLGGLPMPNFHEITNESNPQSVISKYINAYSEMTGRNVIVYLKNARIPRLLKVRMNRKFRGTFIFTCFMHLFL